MDTKTYYNLNDFVYVKRKDGYKSKRYKHFCIECQKDRGYAYKNKILKEPFCHSCKMHQPDVIQKISINSKQLQHTDESKQKISDSLYSRYGTSPIHTKLARKLRSRINKALHGNYKTGSAVSDLGCSIGEFKTYIESLWTANMSWDNYGVDGWHIDHIKPLCQFILSDKVEFKKACHYTNLQPLWASDNLAKRKTDGTF